MRFCIWLTFCCYISQIQVMKVFQAVRSAVIKNVVEPQETWIAHYPLTLTTRGAVISDQKCADFLC